MQSGGGGYRSTQYPDLGGWKRAGSEITTALGPPASQVARTGGVAAVVSAMINCPDDAGLQHFGCWALANLAFQSNPAASATTASNDPGASTSRRLLGSRELAELAAETREAARAQGAVEVCKMALSKFPRHPGVVEKGRLALGKLTAT